jgi:hypothetical protein
LQYTGRYISKWVKSNYKGLTIVGVMFVASIVINAYIGFGPPSSPPPSSVIKTNFQSNATANPFAMRISFHLTITADNKPVVIPSQIGIEPPLWQNHTLDKYGSPGMSMPGMTMTSMAPIYTNSNSGLIKIGSTVVKNYTLGDFFNIWGMNLNDKTVNAIVDGKSTPDYRNHILKDGEQIILNITSKNDF